MSKSLIGLLAITLALGLISCQLDADLQGTSNQPAEFATHCASCHGTDLQGGIAQSLLDGSWQFGSRDKDIFRSIKFGHPHHGMPSWANIIEDAQIDTLVSYLRREEARIGLSKPPLPEQYETQDYWVDVDVIADGLTVPWAIAFLSNEKALITEKAGPVRIWENGQLHPDPVEGTPAVRQDGQGGMMDVAIGPDYESEGWIYLSFSHGLPAQGDDENTAGMTKIVRGKLQDKAWVQEETLFEAPHDMYRTTRQHFGSRIVFDPEGLLYFSIGDRGAGEQAQDLSRPNGKIHRIHRDGTIPQNNPFVRQSGAMPSVFSYGHRNPQGLAIHPETGQLWSTEHGPLGGDELNLVKKGKNYGWPIISYGLNYNGTIFTELTHQEGMEQPNWYWKPSIAVCGLDFYHGAEFPKWNNRLLVGALKFEEVQLLDIAGERVIYRQTILKNGGRVRDVTTGPDGAIYVVLNNPGRVIKLTSSLKPAI